MEETERNIREAIELHLEVMRGLGITVPEPGTRAGTVSVAA
jgi:predicted RNase H-like HicB family nuclease